MPALIPLESASLMWQKAGGAYPIFALHAKEGTVATLSFPAEDPTLARVETAGGVWTLKHRPFPDAAVTLRAAGSRLDLATFHPHLLGNGKLVFHGGETFDWVRLGGPDHGVAFLDVDGLPLVHLSVNPDGDSPSAPVNLPLAQVDTARPHRHPADPALLAAVAWYLIQLETKLEDPGVAAETCLRM